MDSTWHPRSVVVGVDGSEQSGRASKVAAALARTHGAALFLVTVVRPPEGWWGMVGSPPPSDAVAKALARAAEEVLDTTVANLDMEGLEWESGTELGDPAESLAQVCRERAADLLIVGRRGAGLVERIVLGSTADRVLRLSPCPVLIVP